MRALTLPGASLTVSALSVGTAKLEAAISRDGDGTLSADAAFVAAKTAA